MQNGPTTMNYETAVKLNTETLSKDSPHKDMKVTLPYGVSKMIEEVIISDKKQSTKLDEILSHKDEAMAKLNKAFANDSAEMKDYLETVASYFAIIKDLASSSNAINQYLDPVYKVLEAGKLTDKTINNDYSLSISELSYIVNRALFKHEDKLRAQHISNLAMGTLIYQKMYALQSLAKAPFAIDENKATKAEKDAHAAAVKKAAAYKKKFEKFDEIIKDLYKTTSTDIFAFCFQTFGRAGDLLPASLLKDMKNIKISDSYSGNKHEAEQRLEAFKVCAGDLQFKLSQQPQVFNSKVVGKYQDAFAINPLSPMPSKAQVLADFIVAYETKMSEYKEEQQKAAQKQMPETVLAATPAPVVFSAVPKRALPDTPKAATPTNALPTVSTTSDAPKIEGFAAKQALVAGILNRNKP